MRIELEDALDPDVPVRDVHHLGDTVVRFRLAQPLPLSPYQQFLLDGRSDVAALVPSAPNRAAVEQLLDGARTALTEGFQAQRGSALVRRAGVTGAIDFLRFCIDHFCRPTCLYTNASAVVSVFERGGILEAIPHPSLKEYLRFGSEYGRPRPPATWMGDSFASLQAAETWIVARLAQLPTRSISLTKGSERRTLFLQSAGERPGERRYPIETFLLHGAGEVRKVRVLPGRSCEFLNGIEADGFRARCCATCVHFSFSGMSWDMSNGTAGHCARRSSDPGGDPPGHGLTGTFDVCEQHELVDEATRLHRSRTPTS
jgi:hypothetical protein